MNTTTETTTTEATPVPSSIQVTAVCNHCAQTITRTSGSPAFPWYHQATGLETCTR